ncbi:MAG: cell division protein FtsZ [Alphaproteobacteria bacterium]
MTLNLSIQTNHDLKPKITVIGVGGAGGNAVNNMITSHLEGVEFVVANTDSQALSQCLTERRIQLGSAITHGLGAGARPEVGRAAAEEALDEILSDVDGSHMVFITAGMGGGTGTGAAPAIARAVRERGILTVGVVTKPFSFEGAHRMRIAEAGLEDLQQYVDTLIIIPNQNLFRIANERTTLRDAFELADQVLHMGVRGVTDLIVMPGLINLDFADIRTVMAEMGKAMMGTGEAEGDRRAVESAEAAISNPLLDEISMRGAQGVLINITGGQDMTLFEVDAAANRIREEVDADANIIFGSTFDETMEGKMRVSVVATGIESAPRAARDHHAATDQPREPERKPEPVSPLSSLRFRTEPHRVEPLPHPNSGGGAQPHAKRESYVKREPQVHRLIDDGVNDGAAGADAHQGFQGPPAVEAATAEEGHNRSLFRRMAQGLYGKRQEDAPRKGGRPPRAAEEPRVTAEPSADGELPHFLRREKTDA